MQHTIGTRTASGPAIRVAVHLRKSLESLRHLGFPNSCCPQFGRGTAEHPESSNHLEVFSSTAAMNDTKERRAIMDNKHANEPRWLETAAGFDLEMLTHQEAYAIMCLVGMRWVDGYAHRWFTKHHFCSHRLTATGELVDRYQSADLVENARVFNHSQFTRESACMLLCFAEVVWMDRWVLDYLSPCSDCGGWWSATETLQTRLRHVEYTFG